MVDAMDLKSIGPYKPMSVRVRPSAGFSTFRTTGCRINGGSNPDLLRVGCQNRSGSPAEIGNEARLVLFPLFEGTRYYLSANADLCRKLFNYSAVPILKNHLKSSMPIKKTENTLHTKNSGSGFFDNRGFRIFFFFGNGLFKLIFCQRKTWNFLLSHSCKNERNIFFCNKFF